MAESIHANRTNIEYIGKHLPAQVVAKVVEDIQKLMMDEVTNTNRPGTMPNMPRTFLCSEVVDNDKEEIMKIAGEEKLENSQYPECYEIIVPFLTSPLKSTQGLSQYIWSGNLIEIDNASSIQSDLAVLHIKGVYAREKHFSKKRGKKYFPTTMDMKDIPSNSLKMFLQSPMVSKQPSGDYLISSHKMTITWLRSRLDKALHKYREVKKDVEVIATIKQKDGGPLFLRLQVEKKDHRGRMTRHDSLLVFFPAFRMSQCKLVVPVLSLLDPDVYQTSTTSSKYCLWKKITKCDDSSHKHKNESKLCNRTPLSGSDRQGKVKQLNRERIELTQYKASIDKKPKLMTQSQQRQCQQCENPASRMLLEYYYQYGHIPDDEMSQTTTFVWEILKFLKASIEEDQKFNEPKILKFVESGSVSESLKVVQPDEFDVMIAIDLPDSTECYTFREDNSFPTGYAICQVRRSKSFSSGLQRCFRKSDEFGHCLAPEQLAFGWLNSKLELAINKYKEAPEAKADLKVRRSGPALLLEITPSTSSKLPRKISVDLVLALQLSENDSRYAVAKRAKVEQFYKKVVQERNATTREDGHYVRSNDERKGLAARKNLKYLWRISYSAQEKRYLEYAKEIQLEANGVVGCQNICLMILKTICTREILKREESVICHKLSSYILKTALFHVLAKSNLIRDWQMDCLADRYVDLLDELSKWQELPHFFFDNAANLRMVFPQDPWCENTSPKNLLDELHATLKIQLLYRFCHIANSFKECKQKMDGRSRSSSRRYDYSSFLATVLGRQTLAAAKVIHPPFDKSVKPDEESRKFLAKKVSEDRKVGKAAKSERKSGPLSDQARNLERPEEDERKSNERHQKAAEKQASRMSDSDYLPFYDACEREPDLSDILFPDEPDHDDFPYNGDYDDDYHDDYDDYTEFWGYWND